jgi:hypothetical protein
VDKIHDFKVILKDSERSVEDRRFALRFLAHCIEEIHMPLHVGDNNDKGGNQTRVRFFDQGTNIHRLWDSRIIERVSDKEDFWLTDLTALDTAENRVAWMGGTIEDWATESLLAARQAYQVPETGRRLKPGHIAGRRLPIGQPARRPQTVVSKWFAAGDGAQRGFRRQVIRAPALSVWQGALRAPSSQSILADVYTEFHPQESRKNQDIA